MYSWCTSPIPLGSASHETIVLYGVLLLACVVQTPVEQHLRDGSRPPKYLG